MFGRLFGNGADGVKRVGSRAGVKERQPEGAEYIVKFDELSIEDVPLVGGKNAALGEMISELTPLGVKVPNGFAITAEAYRYVLRESDLDDQIVAALEGLDTHDVADLQKRGKKVRELILAAHLPDDLQEQIRGAYQDLEKEYGKTLSVAVRSSATAEDLPGASFAGQQETYLNVKGADAVIEATKKAMASLFTDRAISYRVDKGFSHFDVALSVGVQKMVRSDVGVSGIMFSIDTETGFENAIVINASYGLGAYLVGGQVTPDDFIVFKPALRSGKPGIISRTFGIKDVKLVYGEGGTKEAKVPKRDREKLSLTDAEVDELARAALTIEEHFSKKHGHYQPMDMEWAKDGETGELFIVQARPETIHAIQDKNVYHEYRMEKKGTVRTKGNAIGMKVAAGPVHVITDVSEIHTFKKGEVLVTEITDPDWEPIMKIASAIVTDKGGRTSHAAIVSRELGIPAIVGTGDATSVLKTGDTVTIDCSSGTEGYVYEGKLPFQTIEHRLDIIPKTKTKIMVNIGSPDEAFVNHYLPVSGVGLGRLEFIIASGIGIHPRALIDFASLKKEKKKKSQELVSKIEERTVGYKEKSQFYVDKLAEGIGKIGAAFYPNPVIIRFSDFKSNEYRTLLGGDRYEPKEANPMIGWRGASRYYSAEFADAFALECQAVVKARNEMGVTNVAVMVPFCRTVEEGKRVIEAMKKHGLDRKRDETLEVYVMCEVPSNVILADDFLDIFDGMSIGTNDLTQLVLGLDRDSNIISKVSDERDPAVIAMVKAAIERARKRGKYIGICGQAPSDFPEFAEMLVEAGIESMSLNPDTVIKTIPKIAEKEK